MRSTPISGSVAVLTALEVERRAIARGCAGLDVALTGPHAAVAEGVRAAAARGAGAVLLAGLGGGLEPGLAGAIVSGEIALESGGGYRSPLLRRSGVLGDGPARVIVGVDAVVRTPEEKAALHRSSGAALVDMESHLFARAAEAEGLPWAVVRSVSDASDERLPARVSSWVDAAGRSRAAAVVGDVLLGRASLAEVRRVARGASSALRALPDAVAALADRVGVALRRIPPLPSGVSTALVFGGSFDPPTRAHAALPTELADATGAGAVLVVPAGRSPHKREGPTATGERRAEWLRAAFARDRRVLIATAEIEGPRAGGGATYTIDTVAELRAVYGPGVRLRLVIGADQAASFHRWRDAGRLIELAEPLVVLRPPVDRGELMAILSEHWPPEEAARWGGRIVEVPERDVSSTEARLLLGSGSLDDERLGRLLPGPVLSSLRRHNPYRTGDG